MGVELPLGSISVNATPWAEVWIDGQGWRIPFGYVPHLDEVTGMEPTRKATRIAEVRFLRALMYFHLVQNFGDIPLLLTESKGIITEMTRDPQSAVYDAASLEVNLYTGLFTEQGILVAEMCYDSDRLTLPVCNAGRVGAADLVCA